MFASVYESKAGAAAAPILAGSSYWYFWVFDKKGQTIPMIFKTLKRLFLLWR
jgi:hypothetical protein